MSGKKLSIATIKITYEEGLGIGLEYLGPARLQSLVKDFFIKIKNQIEEDINNDCCN